MTGPVRTLALATVIVALAVSAAPAPASASVAGTFCGLAGWVSGLVSKACTLATHAGRLVNAGKKLAGGHLGGAIGALAGSTSSKVAKLAGIVAAAAGVVAGAQIAMKLTVEAVSTGTTPNLEAVWFSSSYWRMAAVAALLTVPFLFAAAIQAMLRSDLTLLLRSAFGYLPLGMLAVGIAAPVTALLLAASDEMSTIVSSASGHEGVQFLGHIGALSTVISGASGTVFLSFFIALFTIAAAITLWLELLIRQAAVYVIVLMLPLFFAAMVWPARRIWAARAVELLVALILAKFAIVAVLGLGGAALGHTLLPGVGSLLAGTTLVLLAAFSPWAMLRLLPLHELAGAAVGGLRPHGLAPVQATDGRSHGATDTSEDAMQARADAGEARAADPAGEEVATGVPARLRLLTRRGIDSEDGSDAGGHDDDPRAPHPESPHGNGNGNGAIPDVHTDAFASATHARELPDAIRSLGSDAAPIALDESAFDGGGRLPDVGPVPPVGPEDAPV